MLTVIIYKKSSQAFIDRYRSLFEPYRDAGKIAFCFWDESGTDISSALPELKSIVRGIRKWRALVVLPMEEKEDEANTYESQEDNPFDFLCNEGKGAEVFESPIPIIRLSQMLGGIPLVHGTFINTMKLDNNRVNRMVTERKETKEQIEEQQRLWNELNDKYSFNCERPHELYLFAARKPAEIKIPTVKDYELSNRYESDASLFWYKNRYPAMTRFLTQDCSGVENARYHEDLFSFWMTVLTLALNEFSTGKIGAYKLYHVKSVVEREKLHEIFSDYYNRLDNIRFSANKQIIEIKKSAQFTHEINELPHFNVDIPVEFNILEDKNLRISSKKIGLSGDCPIPEEPWWYEMARGSNRAVIKLFKRARIVLDRACVTTRFSAKVLDEEIHELDEYQYEDMNEQLSEIEKEILTFSAYKIVPIKKYKKQLNEAKKKVTDFIRKRMTRSMTILSALIAVLVYLGGFIPDIAYQLKMGGDWLTILAIAFGGSAIMLFAAVICMFIFQFLVKWKIGNYNRIIKDVIEDLSHAEDAFSRYLSMSGSYMRGRYMLQALEERAKISNDGMIAFSRHAEHLESQMGIVQNWLNDFELEVLPDKGKFQRVDFDFEIEPEKNKEYFMQTKSSDLNIVMEDGDKVLIPYSFVTQFVIKRENIFEKKIIEKGEQEDV